MEASEPIGELLVGGMMNTPRRVGQAVHRPLSDASETIQRLLRHVRSSGIDWVPEPLGILDGQEIVGYLEGSVPHDMPSWIWSESVVRDVAAHARAWHDATLGFDLENSIWNLDTRTSHEVVCHNDFAPYNCVFDGRRLIGLIDFDLCAPGSRVWDLAYTAYRFIPVMPSTRHDPHDDISPFGLDEILSRLDLFLDTYSAPGTIPRPTRNDLLLAMVDRLLAISEWTRLHAERTANEVLARNATMYERHSAWILAELLDSHSGRDEGTGRAEAGEVDLDSDLLPTTPIP